MNRRGFLWIASLCAAGTALDPKQLISPLPAPSAADLNSLLTPQWMAIECANAIKAALGDWQTVYLAAPKDHGRSVGAVLGDVIAGQTINWRRHVSFRILDEPGEGRSAAERFRNRYARPVGETLAAVIRHHRVQALTDMPRPNVSEAVQVASKDNGIALRLCVQYDPEMDCDRFRADVCGVAA